MSDSDDELVSDYLRRLEAAAAGLPGDRRFELIEEITAHIAEARASLPAEPGRVRTVLDQLGSPEDIVRAAGATPFDAPGSSGAPGPFGAAQSPGAAGSFGASGSSGAAGPFGAPESFGATGSPGAAGSFGAAGPLGAPAQAGRPGALEIVAVIALLVGGLVIPVIGWIVGVVLLWVSNSWRTRDKILGTLVWPGGLLAPLVVLLGVGIGAAVPVGSSCSSSGDSSALGPYGGFTVANGHVLRHSTCSGAPIPPWLAIAVAALVLVASIAGPIVVAIRLLRQARRPAAPYAQPAQGPLVSSIPV